MDKVKDILFKKHYIREVMLLFFIVLSLLFLSIYTSFAMFEKRVEKDGIAAIVASNLDIALSTTNITVPAGETVFEDITLTNKSNISAKYKLYASGISDNIILGISNESENAESGIINLEESIIVKVQIINGSTSDETITLGVKSGYAHNEIVLDSASGESEFSLTATSNLNSFSETSETCFVFDNGTISDYDVNTCGTDVVIPSTINDTVVKRINSYAFYDKQLTSLSIPDSVIYIDDYAFYKNQLTNVVIPGNITYIGNYAFAENPDLTSIYIQNMYLSDIQLGEEWYGNCPEENIHYKNS